MRKPPVQQSLSGTAYADCMPMRVSISQAVLDAIDAQMHYFISRETPPDRLAAWHTRLFDLIDSLGDMPSRFPVSQLTSDAVGYEVRRANFGDYAVYFRIDTQKQLVEIVAFRHAAQQPWQKPQ